MNPSRRIAVHHSQKLPFKWQPSWQPANSADATQRFSLLVEFKMA
jgi:hypothetical protein